MHKRTYSYEDLSDHAALDQSARQRYQTCFIRVISPFAAIAITLLVIYASFQLHKSSLSWQEMIGVFGGLLSVYTKFHKIFGHTLLNLLHCSKNQAHQKQAPLGSPVIDYISSEIVTSPPPKHTIQV